MSRELRLSHRCLWLLVFLPAFAALAAQHSSIASDAAPSSGQSIDAQLERVIAETLAIDDHAHPILPQPNDSSDRDFDALPVDNMAPETEPSTWKADNPQLPEAWVALWGFKGSVPLNARGMKDLQAARARVKAREKEHYAVWVLDQAAIDTMLANRVSMGPGIESPRFRWVPYADALLFPLDNSGLARATPDRAQFFPLEDRLRLRYLDAAGLSAAPATLEQYLSKVVTPTLEQQKARGAIAEKFEIAYLRGFDFGCHGRGPFRVQ